jgi:hypothetical protein
MKNKSKNSNHNSEKLIEAINAQFDAELGGDEEETQEVEVLYQKMGDRWYAFSLVDDEVYIGPVPTEELAKRR